MFRNIFGRLFPGLARVRGAFRTLSNIFDKAYFTKIVKDGKSLTIFGKRISWEMFDWVLNTPPIYKLLRRKPLELLAN